METLKVDDKYILKVRYMEVHEFYYRITWNKIRTYLSEIIIGMEKPMRDEIRSKRTDLIHLLDEKGKEVYDHYRFETREGSPELNKYLEKFLVVVIRED